MAPSTGSGHPSVIAGISSTGSINAPTTVGANVPVITVKTGTITVANANGANGAANRRCLRCGDPLTAKRSTRSFCSPRCQKAAKRREGYEPQCRIIDLLRQRGPIGQVWPVYRSDLSPRVFALMVPRAVALAELIIANPSVADDDLIRTLRRLHVGVGPVEADLIERHARRRKTEEAG
jgi:hypothetical protein